MATFTQSQLQAIADALGDTEDGLIGSEIAHLLQTVGIVDTDPQMTKRHRLYNAFANDQNRRKDRTRIIGFVRKAMKPERFAREQKRFEPMRGQNKICLKSCAKLERTVNITLSEGSDLGFATT
ncbi:MULTISPECIES: hypothetical protein [Stappiaceae]|jgi:hypothetical protein|uniref:hypothetical protein n=1 Tax=Stappiaceae TaxID=2821832 RepID=UPI001E29174E|nr:MULTISPECIES: hypothetical protein [Stappiaceae]UFI06711.1 hypothetical protein ST40_028795 [Roseibium aggregatum]